MFADIAERNASGASHAEGARCYVESVKTEYCWVTTRGSHALNFWVESWVYDSGGSDPKAGTTLQLLHDSTPDHVFFRTANGGGSDTAAALPYDIWKTNNVGSGVMADVGGDVHAQAGGTAWAQAFLETNALTNMPSGASPGKIFLRMKMACITGIVGSFELRSAAILVRDGLQNLGASWYHDTVNLNSVGFSDAANAIGVGGFVINAYETIHAVLRVGYGAWTGARPLLMWASDRGFWLDDVPGNESFIALADLAWAAPLAVSPALFAGSTNSTGTGGVMGIREFIACTMEE